MLVPLTMYMHTYQIACNTVMITGCPSLKIFDLSENDIGDDGISLCVHHINNLTELKLELCGLSDKGTACTLHV